MQKKLRGIVTGVLAAVFVFGVAMMLRQLFFYEDAREIYQEAQHIAFGEIPKETTVSQETEATHPQTGETLPQTEEAPVQPQEVLTAEVRILRQLDVDALQLVNPDVLGWIYIPDTVISYPLLQTDERDEYLYKAWDGRKNDAGSIFLEKSNHRDFSDFNTIIYGHLMGNGTMFGSLKAYYSREYRDSHPYIYIATETEIYKYEVFAVYEADVKSDTYRLYFEDDTRKQVALDSYIERSILTGLSVPTVQDSVLTLSTCTGTGTYSTRWVVQAVRRGTWEK